MEFILGALILMLTLGLTAAGVFDLSAALGVGAILVFYALGYYHGGKDEREFHRKP